MARLLVLRHGKTELASESGRDFDRELVSRGRRNSADMGALIRDHMPKPDMVLASPAMRTRQTAEWVLSTLDPECQPVFDDHIYNASGEALFRSLKEHAGGASTVLMIGHNPGMVLLSQMMLPADDEHSAAALTHFPTCALADIAFDDESLGGAEPGQGKLLSLLRPSELGFKH